MHFNLAKDAGTWGIDLSATLSVSNSTSGSSAYRSPCVSATWQPLPGDRLAERWNRYVESFMVSQFPPKRRHLFRGGGCALRRHLIVSSRLSSPLAFPNTAEERADLNILAFLDENFR